MKKWIFILCGILFLTSCQYLRQDKDSTRVNIKIERYDRLQFEAFTLNSVSAQQRMNIEHPKVTKFLIEDILSLGRVDDPYIFKKLNDYFTDSTLTRLILDSEEQFSDMQPIEQKLSRGFKFLKKEIPNFKIPKVYSLISALNQSIVVDGDLVCFSIDKYLGADYPLYQRYYYPHQLRSMSADRIPIDILKFYLISCYPFKWEDTHRTLLDLIMYRGKIGWIVQHALGYHISDPTLMGYTGKEQEWAEKHKQIVWKDMKEHGLLDKTDPMIIRILTQPVPQSLLTPFKLPPLFGVWLGIRIIDQYMKQHPQTTIEELLKKESFTDFIDKVNFK